MTSTLSSLTECQRSDTEKKNVFGTRTVISRETEFLIKSRYQQDRNIRMRGAAQKWRADLFEKREKKKERLAIASRALARNGKNNSQTIIQ